MGIGRQVLNLTLSLFKDQQFKDFKSVVELGSQDIHGVSGFEVATVMNQALGVLPPQDADSIDAEWFYKKLGFEKYKCIDMDGRHNALAFNLNEDISLKYGFKEKFDLVTDHGTTEHCFDQFNVFRNAHNLCAKGGIMIHGLPFQGHINHGLFQYQPALFDALAAANNYQIIGIYLNINSGTGDISTYSNELMKYIKMEFGTTNCMLLVVMKKIDDQEFKIPYDGMYFEWPDAQKTRFTKTPIRYFPTDHYQIDPLKIVNCLPSKTLLRLVAGRIYHRSKAWLKNGGERVKS